MSKPLALIVDDEPDICELLELTLDRMDVDCRTAMNLKDAHQLLNQYTFNFCLTDMRLPDGNGIDLVSHIHQKNADMPVAVLTAHGNMESAIEALKAGAFDFVSKPVNLNVLRNLVQTAIRLTRTYPEMDPRTRDILVGDSDIMKSLRGAIAKIARSQAPVYISGESGTGKELVARMLHDKGPRSDEPFIPVNCGAIPAELMESEFFGHKKGSFTGATLDKKGLFQAADGGSLFLDELADLPLHMQVKLLRAIQERAVRPVGGSAEIPVNVRILCATHKDLGKLVEQGEFRQDLYYRLNVIEMPVPALRHRSEDLPQLVAHILKKLSAAVGGIEVELSDDAMLQLSQYQFPGNVRELENLLERAMTLCENNVVKAEDLKLKSTAPGEPTPLKETRPMPEMDQPLEDYLEEVERQAIQNALEQTGHNKTAAARKLGITFRALRYRLKKLGLE